MNELSGWLATWPPVVALSFWKHMYCQLFGLSQCQQTKHERMAHQTLRIIYKFMITLESHSVSFQIKHEWISHQILHINL